MPRKLFKKEFVTRANAIHHDKYLYDKSIYVNTNTKLIITCKDHGDFEQRPNDHISGCGCPTCGIHNKKTTEQFIFESKNIHDDKYDYSKTIYINANTKLIITCKDHGDFEQVASLHLTGSGCPKCPTTGLKTLEEFIQESNALHNNLYDYSKSAYINNNTKLIITCKKHGDFLQTPSKHLSNQGCPVCKLSKGEKYISTYLKTNNIKFERQYKFDECINPMTGKKLKYDFFIPKLNMCIEYDGIQHFSPRYFGTHNNKYKSIIEKLAKENLDKIRYLDSIKDSFCKYNDIKLIRIHYDENIDSILNKIFNYTG